MYKNKEEIIEEIKWYEDLLLSALRVYLSLPKHLQLQYDKMIAEYIKELKILNKRAKEMT